MESKTAWSQDMLGTEKIGTLLVRLSVPATIGMVVNGLYNLVDTIFLGQWVGHEAIGGLVIAFPLQMIAMAVGMMFGFGGSSIISRSLGAGDGEKANIAGGNAFSLSFVIGLVIIVLGQLFITPILRLFGASDTLLPYAYEYMSVILFGTIFTSVVMAGIFIIRGEGKSKEAMIAMILGTGLNIILDPVFIYVFDMGIRGAAVATVIAYGCSFIYVVGFYLSGKSALKIRLKHLVPNVKIILETLSLGISALIRQVSAGLLFIIVNNTLKDLGGDLAISAFGIVFRAMMFLLMPILGIGQGFQPIVGFNYGAKKLDRVKESITKGILYSTLLSLAAFAVMMLFPEGIIRLFNNKPELVEMALTSMAGIALGIPFLGAHIIGSTYFLAVGKAIPALVLMLARRLIFLIPLLLLLPGIWGINGVWFSFPIADVLSAGAASIWMFIDTRKLTSPLNG